MPLRTVAILLLAATIVTGCGRRGPLERPGSATDVETEMPASPGTLDATSPGAQEPAAARPTEAPPRRFILDPLI